MTGPLLFKFINKLPKSQLRESVSINHKTIIGENKLCILQLHYFAIEVGGKKKIKFSVAGLFTLNWKLVLAVSI